MITLLRSRDIDAETRHHTIIILRHISNFKEGKVRGKYNFRKNGKLV